MFVYLHVMFFVISRKYNFKVTAHTSWWIEKGIRGIMFSTAPLTLFIFIPPYPSTFKQLQRSKCLMYEMHLFFEKNIPICLTSEICLFVNVSFAAV